MTDANLKPRPFCGCTDIDPEGWVSTTTSGPACDNCSASAQSVAEWNTRADLPAAVTVKPLEWTCEQGWRWCGKPPVKFADYCAWVWDKPDGTGWRFASDGNTYETAEQAKDAANEYWKQKVLDSVTPAPVAGWRSMDDPDLPMDGTEVLGLQGRKRIRLMWYFKASSATQGWLDENGKEFKPDAWAYLPGAQPEPEQQPCHFTSPPD